MLFVHYLFYRDRKSSGFFFEFIFTMKCFIKNIVLILCLICTWKESDAQNAAVDVLLSTKKLTSELSRSAQTNSTAATCSCGVFLSGQFVRGSTKPPEGNPAVMNELDDQFTCAPVGVKQCASKCLEELVKYLPSSPSIICGSIGRDCFKEKAYLFVNNCNNGWKNTNFSAGREYCCKDGTYRKCSEMM